MLKHGDGLWAKIRAPRAIQKVKLSRAKPISLKDVPHVIEEIGTQSRASELWVLTQLAEEQFDRICR